MNKYILSQDVFYRLYGEKVILYKTKSQHIFSFNAISKDVLDLFHQYNSAEEITNALCQKYSVNHEEIEDGIRRFIEELIHNGILIHENVLLEKLNSLEQSFKNECLPNNQLYSVMFELTFGCNEKCKYCYCVNDTSKKELSFDEIKTVLDDLFEMNVLEIIFTGGELFTRKDVFDILEYAYKKNFLISIFTNGIAIKDADFFRLAKISPKCIHFSIYSSIPSKHDEFTGVKGSFEKTVSAIKKCNALNIPINIKSPVISYNENETEEIIELAKSLNTTIQLGMSVSYKNDGNSSPADFRLQTVEKYTQKINLIREKISVIEDRTCPDEDDSVCGAGKHSLDINPYGDVFPCNSLLLKCGNVREETISEIWNRSQTLKDVRNYSKNNLQGCEKCEYLKYCSFCPGIALLEKNDPLMQYDEACLIAKAKSKINNKKEEQI